LKPFTLWIFRRIWKGSKFQHDQLRRMLLGCGLSPAYRKRSHPTILVILMHVEYVTISPQQSRVGQFSPKFRIHLHQINPEVSDCSIQKWLFVIRLPTNMKLRVKTKSSVMSALIQPRLGDLWPTTRNIPCFQLVLRSLRLLLDEGVARICSCWKVVSNCKGCSKLSGRETIGPLNAIIWIDKLS
jgi:hypothetical protein